MIAPFFVVVSEHAARSLVGRAVAEGSRLAKLREFALQIYSLPDGTEQPHLLLVAAEMLAVAMRLAGDAAPEWAAMQDAQDRILARSGDGFRWLTADAAEIDIGIHAAVQVLSKRSAEAVRAAWLFVNREAA